MKRVKIGLVACTVVVVSVAVLLASITRLAQAQSAPWTVVRSPGVGTLTGVASISANDVWAVGDSSSGTLTEHWNGTAWSIVPSPTVANGKFLGVAAVSTNDVWAVASTGAGPPHPTAPRNPTPRRTTSRPNEWVPTI